MSEPTVTSHGGTRPRPLQELRSPILREHGAAIANACLTRIYQTWPDLVERYGERGRQLTAEDNHWHLNYLDATAVLNDPCHFERYAGWLVSFLGPRGLGRDHIGGVFGFLADELERITVPAEQEAHRHFLIDVLRRTSERVLHPTKDD